MTTPKAITDNNWIITTKLSTGSMGDILDACDEIEFRDGIAPIVPSVRVVISQGVRQTAPVSLAPPLFALPVDATDNYLAMTCTTPTSGASIARVYYIIRSRCDAAGAAARIEITAVDPRSARLARQVLAPVATGGIYYPFTFNPSGVGNSSPTGPGFTFDYSTGTKWTRATAMDPIFAAVNATGGVSIPTSYQFTGADYLPLATVTGSYDPTITGSWDCDGFTAMEALLTVMGSRSRWSFYVPPSGALSVVDLAPTSGAALDLTTMPDLLAWSLEKDTSNTVNQVQTFAPGEVTVQTFYQSTSGITTAWAAGDATAADAGDTTSIGYRLFSLAAPNAAILDGVPMTKAGAPTLAAGSGQSMLVFLNISGIWQCMNGGVEVQVDGTNLLIGRGSSYWVTAYKSSTDLAVTCATMSLAMRSQVLASGATQGLSGMVLRRDVTAFKTTVKAGTAYALSSGVLTTTGADATDYVGTTDLAKETAELGALALRQRPRLSWTRKGIHNVLPPGSVVGNLTCGLGNFTINGAILERVWRQVGPDCTTEWLVDFPPVSQVGTL